jgi:hypothetical protein
MPDTQEILNTLTNFSIPAFQALLSELGYETCDVPIFPKNEWQSEKAMELVSSNPVVIAHAGDGPFFEVIHVKLKTKDKLSISQERTVIGQFLKDHPYGLYLFSDTSENIWHLVNVRADSDDPIKRKIYHRITVGKTERLRTASERIAKIAIDSQTAIEIQFIHDEAFNVEVVTKDFFENYKKVFFDLMDDLANQTGDRQWAHDSALQILNRLMFIYFIQRKGWLGNNPEFLKDFWEAYQVEDDTFYSKWLSVLFFESFNGRKPKDTKCFPPEIRKVVEDAPYLNGGLFTKNEVDEVSFTVSDERFAQIFNFMEGYNFTISEDTPLDKEVAVDPEMIGKVYESLVNAGSEEDLRGRGGIFYTPRIEIDLMCRLSLVDCLSNYLGNREILYRFVFAFEEEDKISVDQELKDEGLWKDIYDVLSSLTTLDPACGSGSFLVGMLSILDDLQERGSKHLKIKESSYDRKKRIVGTSLYGVDVKEWICHIAELRLWLALIVDTDLGPEELNEKKSKKDPLLPYFTFKIQFGDSLVQVIGDVDMENVNFSGIPPDLKKRIQKLKDDKLEFYNVPAGTQAEKIKHREKIEKEEVQVFRYLLEERRHQLESLVRQLEHEIENPETQEALFDQDVAKDEQKKIINVKESKVAKAKTEIAHVEKAIIELKPRTSVPFVWDTSFVEVFEGEKKGFDVVIGNPPYIRQEKIDDPLGRFEKAEYKNKVMESTYRLFPDFFAFDPKTGKYRRNMDKKNDIYSYFYLRGLSLLNEKGSFCFITSNSWLDVGYGRDLQEFLLKHCHIKLIMDNEVKRSFASADVNTVICLFSPPNGDGFENTARFVMFKVPFEEILPFGSVVFDEIEEKGKRTTTEEYRVFPIGQDKLYEDGCG